MKKKLSYKVLSDTITHNMKNILEIQSLLNSCIAECYTT